ncbi:uncharacterized protein LOC102153776 [Canis lupus familiaris]|uniref:uncharacterized protein LOC102153776 n=1 Tax=Canis lupus familiaris TaxID=9615 RepID=UPI0015F19A22|nr:uncharacterized protein LOC102153776 [Canis lupus familiaris]XP_038320905.1 uncharacterized protein LOC102153776 [Canis lupus familiaris]XP_038443084.1 uncharacterized protein LOC102153776 [Canis lupus familiaris]
MLLSPALHCRSTSIRLFPVELPLHRLVRVSPKHVLPAIYFCTFHQRNWKALSIECYPHLKGLEFGPNSMICSGPTKVSYPAVTVQGADVRGHLPCAGARPLMQRTQGWTRCGVGPLQTRKIAGSKQRTAIIRDGRCQNPGTNQWLFAPLLRPLRFLLPDVQSSGWPRTCLLAAHPRDWRSGSAWPLQPSRAGLGTLGTRRCDQRWLWWRQAPPRPARHWPSPPSAGWALPRGEAGSQHLVLGLSHPGPGPGPGSDNYLLFFLGPWQLDKKGTVRGICMAQWLSICLWLRSCSGVLGSRPALGSSAGNLLLPLPMSLPLSVSLMNK